MKALEYQRHRVFLSRRQQSCFVCGSLGFNLEPETSYSDWRFFLWFSDYENAGVTPQIRPQLIASFYILSLSFHSFHFIETSLNEPGKEWNCDAKVVFLSSSFAPPRLLLILFLLPIEVLLLRKLPYRKKSKFPSKKWRIPWKKNFDQSTPLKATQSMNQKDSKEMVALYVNLTSLVDAESRTVIMLVYFLRRTRSHETVFSVWWDKKSPL